MNRTRPKQIVIRVSEEETDADKRERWHSQEKNQQEIYH